MIIVGAASLCTGFSVNLTVLFYLYRIFWNFILFLVVNHTYFFLQDAKHILEYIFAHIVEFKKLNHDNYDE
jgi:hypothetical protein